MANIAIQSEAEWLSVRADYVGGSEIASLFYRYQLPDGSEVVCHAYEKPPAGATPMGCLSSWRTAYGLFNEKAGIVMPADFSSERMDAGRFVEPALAEWSKHKWGWPLRKVRRYVAHDNVRGFGASLDYELHGDGETGIPVEFKNVDRSMWKSDWVVEDDEIVAPPLYYLLQVQHQIGVTGAPYGWIVACVGGNALYRGRIERHEPTIARISAAVTAFWNGVDAQTPPASVADYESVSKQFAYGDKGVSVDLTEAPGFVDLLAEFSTKKADLDRLTKDVDNVKGKIAAQIGEATKAIAGPYKVSWPVTVREEKMIPARKQTALTYRNALTVSLREAS